MNERFKRVNNILKKGMYPRLFSENIQITPDLREVYELVLAFYESRILNEDEIIRNGAYFSRVGNQHTRHFHMCTGDSLRLPEYASSCLKSFFKKGQFRTGYAAHGLFPYRGKFHPQRVKALINIMGLKPGDTILVPMMGSGTALIEASLMGIKSIGFDTRPFCRFMTQTKFDALTLQRQAIYNALNNYEKLFKYFSIIAGKHNREDALPSQVNSNQSMGESSVSFQYKSIEKQYTEAVESTDVKVYNFLLLAYLDSAGYSERSKRKAPLEQFHNLLERTVFVVEKIQHVLHRIGLNPAWTAAILWVIPKEKVKGLHKVMTELASAHGFMHVRTLSRQISGIANTMRNEYIVILQKQQ